MFISKQLPPILAFCTDYPFTECIPCNTEVFYFCTGYDCRLKQILARVNGSKKITVGIHALILKKAFKYGTCVLQFLSKFKLNYQLRSPSFSDHPEMGKTYEY